MSTSTGTAAAPTTGTGTAAASPAAASAGAPATAASTPATTAASQAVATPADATVATQAHADTAGAATTAPVAETAAVPATTTQAPAAGVTFPVRPATTAASTQAPSPAVGHASAAEAGSIGGALFSLLLVVGLILGLGWLAKRMPGLQRGAGSAQLKVVASVALGPRDRAVVVDVGGAQLLLGVGQGGVRHLHTLDAPLPLPTAPATPSPFAQILAQHFGKKP